MDEENKEIADFIKNNPFTDGYKFLEIQLEIAILNAKEFGGAVRLGRSYDYRIVKKIYENVLDKDIVKECGRELYSKDGMIDMLRCYDLIDYTIQYNYNQGNNSGKYNRMVIVPLAKLVEHYWDGIGEWKA